MPKNTILEIKRLLRASDKLDYAQTERLSALLDELNDALLKLPESEKAQAFEIANLTKQKIEMSKLQENQAVDFDDLKQAVVEYELTHPKLTHAVRSIYNFLLGIGV